MSETTPPDDARAGLPAPARPGPGADRGGEGPADHADRGGEGPADHADRGGEGPDAESADRAGRVPAPLPGGGPLTRIVLARHAHARAVETGVVAGHRGCVGLSATGRAQAEALGARLAATGFRPDVVVTSVLPRATQTADIVARHLGLDPATTTRDCDLCERHPGEADGLTWDELRARYGPLDPLRDPDRPMSPGGESGRAFRQRARVAVERLAADHAGRTVLAVSHGGVILAVTLRFLGLGPRSFAHALANTSLTEWVLPSAEPWLLHRFNDAAHLEGTAHPPG